MGWANVRDWAWVAPVVALLGACGTGATALGGSADALLEAPGQLCIADVYDAAGDAHLQGQCLSAMALPPGRYRIVSDLRFLDHRGQGAPEVTPQRWVADVDLQAGHRYRVEEAAAEQLFSHCHDGEVVTQCVKRVITAVVVVDGTAYVGASAGVPEAAAPPLPPGPPLRRDPNYPYDDDAVYRLLNAGASHRSATGGS